MFHHAMMGGYLKPTPLKPYMTYDDHLVWPIHVPRRCEPLITPHLSLWGNARTKATFPTHKKNHNPHPQGGEREGGQDGYITLGGVGGWPAKPGSYIYIYTHIWHMYQRLPICIHQNPRLLNLEAATAQGFWVYPLIGCRCKSRSKLAKLWKLWIWDDLGANVMQQKRDLASLAKWVSDCKNKICSVCKMLKVNLTLRKLPKGNKWDL